MKKVNKLTKKTKKNNNKKKNKKQTKKNKKKKKKQQQKTSTIERIGQTNFSYKINVTVTVWGQSIEH